MDKQEINFSGLTAYLGALLIFLGVCHLHFYYSSFGISIVHYLEFSEILTSFLSFIVLSTILLIFSLVFWISFYYKDKEANVKRNWPNPYVLYLILMFVSFSGYIIAHRLHLAEKERGSIILLLLAGMALLWASLWIFTIARNKWLKEFQDFKKPIIGIFAFFMSIVIVFLVTRLQVHVVKYNHYYNGVTIYFKDSTSVKSSDSLYYLGKTLNNIFLYDSRLDVTKIYSTESIERTEFPGSLNTFFFAF